MENIENQLALVDKSTASELQNVFSSYFDEIKKWEDDANAIVITSETQLEEMKLANEIRLKLKNIRCEVENKRKELKEESLRKGKAIDGLANIIKFMIVPIEEHLQRQEDFIKIQKIKKMEALKEKRIAELQQYEVDCSYYDLVSMAEEQYNSLLEMSKKSFALQKEAERKVQEERVAQEKARQEEEERIRKENEKLKKEMEEQERLRNVEQKRIEAENKKREAELKIKEEKERKVREQLEAKIRAKEEEEKRIKEAEEAEKQRVELEKRKLQQAPDKEKLEKFATELIALSLPEMKSDNGKKILQNAVILLNKTSNYIKEQIIIINL
jgi:trichohyalin